MSASGTPPPRTLQQTERVQPGGPGRGPLSGGMVAQKSMHFGPSAKRMLARMRPERAKVAAVVALAVVSVALFAVGPRILGRATDLIFAGLFGKQLPAGVTQAQAVDTVRASGDARVADMLRRWTTSFRDRGSISRRWARCCCSCSPFTWAGRY